MSWLSRSAGLRPGTRPPKNRIGPGFPASKSTGDGMLDASPSVQTPDEILVRRARERDAGAREELFQRYREDAYRVAYRLLGHEQDALDVVQERSSRRFWAWQISMVAAGSGTGSYGSSATRPWTGEGGGNGGRPSVLAMGKTTCLNRLSWMTRLEVCISKSFAGYLTKPSPT